MANLNVKDGAAASKYLKSSGAGTDGDPHIPEHLDTNSAAILAALGTIDTDTGAIATDAAAIEVLLGTIDTDTGAIATDAAAIEVLLTAMDADTSTLAGAVSGTEVQVDIVSSALPSGAATSALQTSGTALLTTIDADTSTLAGAVSGSELQVDVVTSALPTGAATSALQVSGTALLTTIDADTSTIAGAVSGSEVQVDVVAALPAGENLIGLVGASDNVVSVTPTLGTAAYTAGDLLFDSTAIANAVRANGYTAIVESIIITDKDDQKAAMTLVLANAETDFGTVNEAPDADDTEVATVIGTFAVAAADYVDFGGASVATLTNCGLLCEAGTAATSLYLAAITGGTPTHTESGLVFQIGLLRS